MHSKIDVTTGGQTIFPNRSYILAESAIFRRSGNPQRRQSSVLFSLRIVPALYTASLEQSVAVRVGQ